MGYEGEDTENGQMCIMGGCKYHANQKRYKVYPFPSDQNMAEKWIERLAIPSKLFDSTPSAVVCCNHFHEHDFERNNKRKKILKSTAVPTLNLQRDRTSNS